MRIVCGDDIVTQIAGCELFLLILLLGLDFSAELRFLNKAQRLCTSENTEVEATSHPHLDIHVAATGSRRA